MRRLFLFAAAALAILGASAPSASAQVPFAPCPDAGFQAFECATLGVPLDRSGSVPGQVPLFVRRLRSQAGAPQTRTALVALAGGPGQPATPVATSFAIALAPGVRDRDLLVYDQRGTGRSGPLSCPSLRGRMTLTSIGRCARELGPARAFYRTSDSVEDLEALRAAAGYEQLAFYGVSYGTKVALEYAARYPARVERLVLDSVVPPAGPDPLQRSSFRSVSRVLGELCSQGRCNGVTPNPVSDIRTLVRRGRTIRGFAFTSSGRRVRVNVKPQDIYEMLVSGDLNPAWRALLPAAVRAAVRRDGTPLARLGIASLGGSGGSVRTDARALQRDDAGVNQTLFLATACEDIAFPWNRASSIDSRVAQAGGALAREPSSTFSPFDRRTAAGSGVLGQCIGWPNATPAPAPDTATFPSVPALVLNGSADLRTPASDAAAVAARIPGAQFITVPHVGHSVLGADPSGCARAAISGFFTGAGATACPATEPVAPTSRTVRSLGELRATRYRGRVGRTLTAVFLTQEDTLVHALGERLAGSRTRFGGLRGGSISVNASGVTLRKVVVVPGVTVSGRFPDEGDARLSISGRAAARGTLTLSRTGLVTGRLGGRSVRLAPRAQQAAHAADAFEFRHPALVAAAR